MIRLCASMLVVCSGAVALAQPAADDGPGPRVSQPAPAIGDATLQALRGRVLSVRRTDGSVVTGELVGWDAATITMALSPTRDIATFARGDVAGLRLADAPATTIATTTPSSTTPSATTPAALVTAAPARARHFGLQLGLAPGLMLDIESGYFYAFAHADVVLPMASSGDLLGFSVGAGVTFAIAARSRWKMDIFAHLDPVRLGDVNLGGGVGLGFHYTALNGFTLGFKLPIIGYSGSFGSSSSNNGAGIGVAYYYLGGVMGLPVISLGYRF